MIDFFNSCLDFFSMIGRFFVGLYESITNSITAVSSGWDYLNNYFLASAPSEISSFLYSLFVIGVFALLISLFRGRG